MPSFSFKYFSFNPVYRIVFFLLVSASIEARGQGNHYIIIDSIKVEGNLQSERFVLERELLFKYDSIYESADLDKMATDSRNLLMNTNLFITAEVKWEEVKPKHVVVKATVREKWYKWPIPIFQLADRNYNQWAQQDYKMNRTNYGLRYNLYNFRGRNETLKLIFVYGYTRKYGIEYTVPFLDKTGKYGLDVSTQFSQNREIWYLTQNNKLQFFYDFENTLVQRFDNKLALITRRNNFTNERWEIQYNNVKISDTIHSDTLNPYYLLGAKKQNEFYVRHVLNYERRDNKFYPLTGFFLRNELSIGSISTDTASIEVVRESIETAAYKELTKNLYLSGYFKFYISNLPIPFIPYNNYKAFGYNDYVRGYEQYVVDGQAFMLAKVNLKYAVLHQYMLKFPFKFNKQKLQIPFGVYLNLYGDWGKAYNNNWDDPKFSKYNSNNTLIKTDLVGYGAGLDILFLNNKLLRFEYSLNIIGDQNFNLHFKTPF